MARDHARINLTIWGDPDFRALPMPAQHLYLALWTHPDLSYCGALDWRPGKLSGLSAGTRKADIIAAADCLQARHFLIVDEETEEAALRSWIRWDGLMKQPRMAVSCVTAYSNLGSEVLRRVIVHELTALREREPNLTCWADDRVAQVLTHPSVSAKSLPTPSDPFGDVLHPTLVPSLGVDLPQTEVGVCTPPTPAPTPATQTPTTRERRRKPSRPLPEDWKPNAKHAEYADEKNLDLADQSHRFRGDAIAKDKRYANWDQAFRNWLDKAVEFGQVRPARAPVDRLPTVAEVQRMREEREARERGESA